MKAISYFLSVIALCFSALLFGAVDINSADAKTLEGLPGIGPAKAKAIIEHREKNGAFKSTSDLKSVDGIGDKTFEAIKDQITADPKTK